MPYSGTHKLVNMGFPFETIVQAGTRNEVMQRVLDFFGLSVSVEGWEQY